LYEKQPLNWQSAAPRSTSEWSGGTHQLAAPEPLHPLARALGNGCLEGLAEDQARSIPVSQPGDPVEQEAELVAAHLLAQMNSVGHRNTRVKTSPISDELGQMEEANVVDESASVAPRPRTGTFFEGAAARMRSTGCTEGPLERKLANRHGPGQPLDGELRQAIEPLLGVDLSTMRTHPYHADESAAAVGARAFTVGRHIYFGQGQYSPGTREGLQVFLHELVHTLQPGDEAIRRTPSISSWTFRNTGAASADNCAPLAAGANLGVDSKFYGSSSFTNGMQLQAFISGGEAGARYDIKRIKERSTWDMVGGVWNNTSHAAAGTDDDSTNSDECLTPTTVVPYLPYIYSLDEPGVQGSGGLAASATEAVYKATFREWVEITDASGGKANDGNWYDWHSITWLTKTGGSWGVDPLRSEISSGAVAVGTTAP
jgi:hypothetical protein